MAQVDYLSAKILIAEDDDNLRKTLMKILIREGFCVASVSNGQEALELMELQNFDVIITDYKMPVLGGEEWVKRLNELQGKNKILLLSAFLEEAKVVEEEVGEKISKPFKRKDLVNKIISLLKKNNFQGR
ncbi:two-component system, cell cycle response regulator CpdR [Thermotomaculum hydrothermale]|uniref:Two-component system, cell cycle response regulator CpdR n=1 Tax=Thermotomaculum hydrothermale TaxID=981385 RepID=A0A7R6PQY6_9BACT|nr:response regulator [Thermotomaculum hydrothermale]BBB32726.1 two-component system, cell cycle response regulator CpdR [Thermotomaculum hydrothermale]